MLGFSVRVSAGLRVSFPLTLIISNAVLDASFFACDLLIPAVRGCNDKSSSINRENPRYKDTTDMSWPSIFLRRAPSSMWKPWINSFRANSASAVRLVSTG